MSEPWQALKRPTSAHSQRSQWGRRVTREKTIQFTGVKVFSATLQHDRDRLGEKITAWLAAHASLEVVDIVVTQSSDKSFHCVSITVFYRF